MAVEMWATVSVAQASGHANAPPAALPGVSPGVISTAPGSISGTEPTITIDREDHERDVGPLSGPTPREYTIAPHGTVLRYVRRADEARWLLVARETGAHRELGYGSFTEYLERRLGYAPRTARERIRVAEKLTQLPQLRAALARGEGQDGARDR